MSQTRSFARSALAAGYADAGDDAFPIPAGTAATVDEILDWAETHGDDEHLIEATLILGRVTGAWAVIFNRRARLSSEYIAAATAAAAALAAELPLRQIIADMERRRAARTEAVDPVAAGAAAAQILPLLRQSSPQARSALRDAIHQALVEAGAEGRTDAWALLSATRPGAGVVAVNWDIQFRQAVDALSQLGDLWAEADGWLADILDGLAGQLGGLLAAGMANGDSTADMISAAQDLLGAGGDATELIVDHAIATALSEGSLALYQSEGLAQVDFITAGDDRVDQECSDAEADSPYGVGDAPVPPLHFRCRCVLAPANLDPGSLDLAAEGDG